MTGFLPLFSAICYTVIHQNYPSSQDQSAFPHNQIVQFVIDQYHRMPDYLHLPILGLTILFDLFGIAQGQGFFHQQPVRIRAQQMQGWQNSSLSPCRDLIRFYESLTVLAWESYWISESVSQAVGLRE
ncbi:MAG: hypothetical protein HC825_06820 [Oscillatoriales cyanobacterium RM1_1_9]|nr:hypothetical protein [Oscillatoriales cyanobacterium RM1_1_9]